MVLVALLPGPRALSQGDRRLGPSGHDWLEGEVRAALGHLRVSNTAHAPDPDDPQLLHTQHPGARACLPQMARGVHGFHCPQSQAQAP